MGAEKEKIGDSGSLELVVLVLWLPLQVVPHFSFLSSLLSPSCLLCPTPSSLFFLPLSIFLLFSPLLSSSLSSLFPPTSLPPSSPFHLFFLSPSFSYFLVTTLPTFSIHLLPPSFLHLLSIHLPLSFTSSSFYPLPPSTITPISSSFISPLSPSSSLLSPLFFCLYLPCSSLLPHLAIFFPPPFILPSSLFPPSFFLPPSYLPSFSFTSSFFFPLFFPCSSLLPP